MLGEIIERGWLTLGDPRLTIIETGLQSSAPAHAIETDGAAGKGGVFSLKPGDRRRASAR
jgi:hypothetical protein